MGTNFHSAYIVDVTSFSVADMNPPFSDLDRAITYLKTVMIGCDGVVSYVKSTGVLSWTGTIHIYFARDTGITIHNQIAAGSVTLSDLYFAYVTLSETADATLTVSTAAISAGSASNFITYTRLVLGFRNTSDDNFYGALLPLVIKSFMNLQSGTSGGMVNRVAEAAASITASASVTITLSIPISAVLKGVQFRVDTALTAGETWDAAYSGGSTTSLVTAGAVAKDTKVNKRHTNEIATNVTNIAITKNGGGSFTAAGVIRAIAYYEDFVTMANS
jgi:hypothetical protein